MTLFVQAPVFVIGRCGCATVRSAHLRPATTSNTEFTETTLHQLDCRQVGAEAQCHLKTGMCRISSKQRLLQSGQPILV
jgi:hypothetical protein